jgi:hypothetical protein
MRQRQNHRSPQRQKGVGHEVGQMVMVREKERLANYLLSFTADDLTQQSNTQQATTQTASAEPCIQQQQQQQPVEAATCSTQQQGRTTSNSRESKATGGDESEDEFACFGRFVAMSLKKVSTRSPIGALEARKEISDVLYRAELNSLPH